MRFDKKVWIVYLDPAKNFEAARKFGDLRPIFSKMHGSVYEDPDNLMKQAREIVDQMFNNDAFSIWLGIERLEERAGYARLQMKVRTEMTNGFGIAHGGITYSLADSALAFASNSHGLQSMSIETSISHTRPVKVGDVLIAETQELNKSRKLAIYEVRVTNQEKEVVALFKGTVFRTEKPW